MRTSVCSLVSLIVLALAGCQSQSSDQAAPQFPGEVSGKVSLHADSPAPSANARLELSVVDAASQNGTPVGRQEIKPADRFPLDYHITINPKNVNPANIYVVHAELIDGERHYLAILQTPVLTQGKGVSAAIELAPQATAGERTWADFQALRKRLGALRISSGSKLAGEQSLAWQVFWQGGTVKFIRELVDYNGKRFTRSDFAYTADGKLWAAEQAQKASEKAPVSASLQAAWDAAGKQVLSQRKAGGETAALAADDVQALQQQAADIFSKAGGK